MNLFRALGAKVSSSSKAAESGSRTRPARLRSGGRNPTAGRMEENKAPPEYSPSATTTTTTTPPRSSTAAAQVPPEDSPYSFLAQFDTVFLVDDSGSMVGRSWRETCAALRAIAPICTTYDQDGVDIYFLNHRNPFDGGGGGGAAALLGGYANVTTAASVDDIFRTVRPRGGTPTGTRLNQILKPYLAELERSVSGAPPPPPKPLNIIVITDGVPSDDVESVIVGAARKLDACNAEPWQVGIQFFQVGDEPDAAADLRELDDALSARHNVRDMVDTVPWSGGKGEHHALTAEECLKVTMGAVNRRLDRRQLPT